MTYQTYPIGFDAGNSETNVVLIRNSEQVKLSIPSYTAIGSMSRLAELGYTLRKDDFIYSDDGANIFVGGLALRQSKTQGSGRGDSGRYWSERARQLLLTTSAALVQEQEYGLHVVTGLPVSVYLASQENRRRVKHALEGTHEFTINGSPRIAHVTVERVIIEGAGATIAYGLPKTKQGVIDIGGFTTDLFASHGQEPLTHLCDGADLGVEMAGDLISQTVMTRHGRALTKNEVRDVLHRFVAGSGKISGFWSRGEEISDLREISRGAVENVGKQIAAWVATVWNDSKTGDTASSFAKVLLIGGGARYFKKYLEVGSTVDEPEFANSLGYALMAEAAHEKR